MGSLTLPVGGTIYIDAQIVLYSTNHHTIYEPICDPVWKAPVGTTVVSSELTLLETLVLPIRTGDRVLAGARETLWRQANTRLLPITRDILREAARLRAAIPGLKSPDAIHAATALMHACVLFITNDSGFRRVPGLPLAILDDILAAP